MELIEIVDENGNFTGEIIERKEAHDRNLLHNEIAVFIVNSSNQILLQKRSANKRFNPNKWGLCAGHVAVHESLKSAAIRELEEEIGIKFSEKELISFADREILRKDTNSHITYFYYLKCNLLESDFIIQEEELSAVKWFDIDKIINLVKNNDTSTTITPERLIYLEILKKLN